MSSETQKILEEVVRQFREGQKAAAAQEAAQSSNSGTTAPDPSALEAPYAKAPEFYPPEISSIFSGLPFEVRKFLHERENSVRERFELLSGELEEWRRIRELYEQRRGNVCKETGCRTALQYFTSLVMLDDEMNINPEDSLRQLARHYGVADRMFSTPTPAENRSQDKEYVREVSGITRKLTELERRFERVNEDFAAARQRDAERLFKEFMEARDEKGRAKHEFFARVKPVVYRLLATGAAADLEEAYEMAIWADADIRAGLIADKTDASIKSKAQEAAKAKEASFAPKGHQKSKPDYSNMTTREVLESLVAQYRNNQL